MYFIKIIKIFDKTLMYRQVKASVSRFVSYFTFKVNKIGFLYDWHSSLSVAEHTYNLGHFIGWGRIFSFIQASLSNLGRSYNKTTHEEKLIKVSFSCYFKIHNINGDMIKMYFKEYLEKDQTGAYELIDGAK